MSYEPTHVDLFSGIGGFALAAKWAGFRTVAFCEIDKYCQKVLAKNFGALDNADPRLRKLENKEIQTRWAQPDAAIIVHDVRNFNGYIFKGCDLITGGFPCQPFSVAGKRGGAADDRALWSEMFRVINEARSAWIVGENVPGIIGMELDNVLSDLESIGYATRAFVIPACAVDARHRRDRVWVIGSDSRRTQGIARGGASGSVFHSAEQGLPNWRRSQVGNARKTQSEPERSNSGGNGLQSFAYSDSQSPRRTAITRSECCNWLPEPDVGRVAHGIPNRVDRLKGLGNAIVPQVAYEILKEIRKLIDYQRDVA